MEYELLIEAEKESQGEDGHTRTAVFRSKLTDGELLTDCDGRRTVYELFTHSCEIFSTRPLHGKREKYVDGSVGDFLWQNYREVEDTVSAVSKGLRLRGCQKGARIGIYGSNAPEWTQAMLSCFYFSAVCVPMYDTYGASAVEFIVSHTEIEFVFTAESKCKSLRDVVKSMGTKARQIREICIWPDFEETDENEMKTIIKEFEDVGIYVEMWTDLVQRGKSEQASSIEHHDPPTDPESMAVLMHTGGSTGVPKGVMISHRAIVSTVASLILFGERNDLMPEEGVHLSWLTLAHIYGFLIEIVSVVSGGKVGYWQGMVDRLADDIATLRPTQLFGVPRIWGRIVDRARAKIEQRGTLVKTIFDWCYGYKKSVVESGSGGNIFTSILDSVLFSSIRESLGGRIMYVASGAAPLPGHVEEFLSVALTVPVLQGYGLTETCAGTCSVLPHRYDLRGTVGCVNPCAEFRLESVPELGYDARGTPAAGEVCFRGPCLLSGYYKNPEEYQKAVDKEGFFHTGDIAQLEPSGALKIIDRKKNIFKLSQGEYVAVEKIESILQQASTVGQIWVYGDSFQRFLVAVVYPNTRRLKQIFDEESSLETLCKTEAVKKEVLSDLTEVSKQAGLKGFERVHDLALTSEEFTIDNGLLTPSHKMKRHDLLRRYKGVIDALYSEAAQS